MAKYNQYIELRPGYESVVDLASEERNPTLWQEYIVHDDMKTAVEKICDSLKMEDMNQRRSFWIHGTYGTGKSYAAIVLKHLFTDESSDIEAFFDRKALLTPYKKKFLSIRKRGSGEFLVAWKSGTTGINNGISLMMEIEMSIRQALHICFGEQANYGTNSLVEEAKRIVNDNTFNWENIFQEGKYHLSDYGDFNSFRQAVLAAEKDACFKIAGICRDKGIAMFHSVDRFEEWIAEIIENNGLKDKGIVLIWDEFTEYIRNNGDDNILQRLSEFCKKQPFFMFLIVHVDTSWVTQLGEQTYHRIMHRYHELEFHITQSAAYDMIGETIIPRAGVEDSWKAVQQKLVREVIHEFDEVSFGLQERQLMQLCPIHPMTLILLTKISENFAASSRTLFSFMKDQARYEQGVGFLSFISKNGPEDWAWLTIDYLWDYFFATESDIRTFSAEARRAYQVYEQKKELFSQNDYILRVFKGALLLIALMSNERGVTYTQTNRERNNRIDATRNTLRKCYIGQLSSKNVDDYLQNFHDTNILLQQDIAAGNDARIELPYGSTGDVSFEVRLNKVMRENTRYSLFKKGGEFSQSIEEKLWDKNDATFSRLSVAACTNDLNSINLRITEIQADLKKYQFKIGLLAVVIPDTSHFESAQAQVREIAARDDSKRIIICVLKDPLKDDKLEEWYRARTHSELSNEEGKTASKQRYDQEMRVVLESWSNIAVNGQLAAFYGAKEYPAVYGCGDLRSRIKNDVIYQVFPYCPERVIHTVTAFKRAQDSAALAGVTMTAPNSAQIKNIEVAIQSAKLWDIQSIEALETAAGTPGAKAVAQLATFINSKMTQGAKIPLDFLWQELQKPPFGYFNSLACAYLLGFVFRFWKNRDFNWVNSDSNPFPLTEINISAMILAMLQEKAVNHTLSSGSEIWQKFKPYITSIFSLSDQEAANEERARFSLIAKIIKLGIPLWALKTIEESKFGGSDAKTAFDHIIEQFTGFAQKRDGDNQEDIMATIVNLFNGRGRLRQTIKDILQNDTLRYGAFKTFLSRQSGSLAALITALKITDNELFDAVKKLMQADINTWTETQVQEKINDLVEEYRVIAALNEALGSQEKTLTAQNRIIGNTFSIMKVPGPVIQTLGYPWFDALTWMNKLRTIPWQNLTPADRTELLAVIKNHGKEAWQNINSSKVLMQKYIASKGISFSVEDVEKVFSEAREWDFDTKKPDFEAVINNSLTAIKHEHMKIKLKSKWQEMSGRGSVDAWCNHYRVPIQWVISSDNLIHFTCLADVYDNRLVSENELYNAIQFFSNLDGSFLKDETFILNKFIGQLGEKYRHDFLEFKNEILTKITIACGSSVYSWAGQGGKIIGVIENHMRKVNAEKFKIKAHTNLMSLAENELRQRILKAMDEYPELYRYFAN